MTKTLLLAATAIAAVGFAGAANAQVFTNTEVSNVTVKANLAGAVTPYTIANESIASSTNRRTTVTAGHNVIGFTTSGGTPPALELNTAYRITYALTGSANPTFLAQIQNSALSYASAVAAECIASTAVAAGTGAGGSSSVSFIVTTSATAAGTDGAGGGCGPADLALLTSFSLDIPFAIGALGTVTANLSGALDPSNVNPGANTNRFSSTAVTSDLVQAANGYRTFVDATVGAAGGGVDDADLATSLALGTSGAPFRDFVTAGGDNIIGAVGFVQAAAPGNAAGGVVRANLADQALPAATYTLSLAGNFAGLKPQTDTDDAAGGEVDVTIASGNATASAAGLGAAQNVKLAVIGTPTASITTTPLSYTATVTPTAPLTAGGFITTQPALTAQALETVGLQGSTFIAPWVQSTNANYNTVIRITNNGTAATGAVQLTIASPNATPTRTTCTSAELSKLANIPANGELAINSADLTTCFGAFVRGDVSITVLSLNTNLTAKLRIVNPGNVVSEQTLNRTSGAGF